MNKTPIRRLFLCLCLLSPAALSAAAPSLAQMEHRRWMAADGGPGQVGALAQTSDGYLWLGTNDSLFRFDGFRFAKQGALGTVSALLAVDNDLWVGLRAGGVDLLRDGTTRHFPAGADFPGGAVYGLARAADGLIWAAADDGLARFDGRRWSQVGADFHFPGKKARAVLVDRDGLTWAANENRLFYLPRGGTKFIDTGLALNWASQIAQATDGAIWITERYGGKLHRVTIDGGRVSSSSANIDTASNGLLFDRGGALWISTLGSGVQHVAQPGSAPAVAARTRFTARDGLSSDYIWPMLEDRDGNLWIGTNAGLDRFRRRTLTPAPFPAGTLNVALAAGADGSLWAGSGNRPAMRLTGDAVQVLDAPAPITSAMRDADGAIWMGGPGGIWRSSASKLALVASLPDGALADSSVRAMARDADGDLWVSINRLGLYKLHAGRWSMTAAPSALPSQLMPVSAAADARGGLWFGYRDNLLLRRDAAGERRWGTAQGLSIGHVTALLPAAERTWVGGQHGIGYIDQTDRFHPLRLPSNGLFENIYAIIAAPTDLGTDLWLHSKAGIFQLTAAELVHADADPAYQIRYRAYDLAGGLANDPYQVLALPTAVRGSDGRLWFSTGDGVVSINQNQLAPAEAGPQPSIESVSVDGVRLASTTPATLAPETRRIVIDYLALNLSAPERLHFRYRLDGYDKEWQDAGRQRSAVYTALPAGHYRFRVLAYNQDGLPGPREAVFSFQVTQVFYRRPLFLILAGLIVLTGLGLLYRFNLRRAARHIRERLEERHSERERIARELHDTLLQGVYGLMLRLQAVLDMMTPDHLARDRLEQALKRADLVLDEGRDRVRDLRSANRQPVRLQDALDMLGLEAERQGGASFSLQTNGQTKAMQPAVQDELLGIGSEAITNAFTHSGARHIKVVLDYADQVFRLSVSDDGCGIDAAYLTSCGRPDHWGLRGMYERATQAGATLAISSTPGQGSEVIAEIDGGLAYCRPPAGLRGVWISLCKSWWKRAW